MGFQNPFKRRPPPQQNTSKEVETAVVLVQYAEGGATMGVLKMDGITKKREATMNDLYRMCCEVKSQIEQIRTTDRLVNIIMQINQSSQTQAEQSQTGQPRTEQPKEEVKVDEVKEGKQ